MAEINLPFYYPSSFGSIPNILGSYPLLSKYALTACFFSGLPFASSALRASLINPFVIGLSLFANAWSILDFSPAVSSTVDVLVLVDALVLLLVVVSDATEFFFLHQYVVLHPSQLVLLHL